MPKFEGPMPGYKTRGNKGIMRKDRLRKREEAAARTKAYKKKLSSVSVSLEGLTEMENEQFLSKVPHLEAPFFMNFHAV